MYSCQESSLKNKNERGNMIIFAIFILGLALIVIGVLLHNSGVMNKGANEMKDYTTEEFKKTFEK